MANHFGLDFDLVELLSRVDANDAADHLGDNDHVAEVSLDEVRLLVGLGLLLRLSELLDEAHRLALQATVEPTSGTGVDEIAEFFGGEVKEPGSSISVWCHLWAISLAQNSKMEKAYWSRSTPR